MTAVLAHSTPAAWVVLLAVPAIIAGLWQWKAQRQRG